MDLSIGHTRLIIKVGEANNLLRNQLAYVLATAYWETGRTMRPVKEAYWVKNAEVWRKNNLRYYPWYGRGFVQITWERNYIKAGEKLGLDLISDADAVMQPDVSAKILVVGSLEGWFTGKKLSDYITLSKSDFVGARRIINGTDKAQTVAELAVEYDSLLLSEGYGVEETPPFKRRPPKEIEELIEDADKPMMQSKTLWSSIATGVLAPILGVIQNPVVQGVAVAGIIGLVAFVIYERRRKQRLAQQARVV